MKNFKRIAAIVLVLALAVSAMAALASCGAAAKVKIGVIVADATGSEALSFRNYYKDYIEKNYDVEFMYSDALSDAEAEKAAIENFITSGCKAIISLASADRPAQIEQCEADGVTIPIVSVQCRYKHPAKMGDIITTSAAIDKVPLAKMVIRQEVRNQDGVVCASGEVMLGFLDKETGHPVRCPEKLARLIESRLNDR